ncbi:MAG: methyl-accepting chemotaxis protein [Oscillospiraceae bacterium]|nr:methyl-accepting chemotaxis protein [Oscillospiraceae bacterium]
MKFKDLKLRNKIVLPVALILVVLIAVLTIYTSVEFLSFGDYTISSKLDAFSNSLEAYLDNAQQATYAASFSMARNPNLVAAVEAEDTAAIISYLTPYVSRYGISYFTVAGADGTALARTADPTNFGQDISGVRSISEALNGTITTSFGSGGNMLVICHTGSPIYNADGVIVGALSAGYRLDTDEVVDELKAKFNAEVTLFAGDTRVNTTVVQNGQRVVGTQMSAAVYQRVNSERRTFFGTANVLGEQYEAIYRPLLNIDGDTFATIFVGVPRASLTSTVMAMIRNGVIIGVVGLVLAVLIILKIANGISKPIVQLSAFMHKAGTTGDITVSPEDERILESNMMSLDEIGKLTKDCGSLIDHIVASSQELEQIANGDLTVNVKKLSSDDTIGNSLMKVLDNLNAMFSEINSASSQVTAGASQIADGATALASGSTEQAATIQELSASIEDIAAKTKENTARTNEAAQLADTIMANAEKGNNQMKQMITAVSEINQANQNISKVIKAIDDIAFQTNILALNAAVEAARAGQAGKGFAVVAEEVRNLAAKSAESAKETAALISNSAQKAELGTRIANETAESLNEIVTGIGESAKIIAEIAQSSGEQNGAIEQINTGVSGVTQVVQQNSATAEQSAAASEEMNGQAEVLSGLISRFRLR